MRKRQEEHEHVLRAEDVIPGIHESKADWTSDVQCAIAFLCATDRSFFLANRKQLKSEYFTQATIVWLLDFLNHYWKKYTRLPPRAIVLDACRKSFGGKPEELSDHSYTLKRIYDYVVSLAEEREHLQDNITSFCRKEAIKAGLRESYAMVESEDEDRFSKIHSIMSEALQVGQEDMSVDYYFEQLESRYEKMKADKDKGLTKFGLGFESIDEELEGGLNYKEVGMFSGLTGTGKSFMLTHVACKNLLDGKKVLFISVENSKEVVEKRIDACLSRVPMRELIEKEEDVVMPTLTHFRSKLKQDALIIKVFPMGRTSIAEMEAFQQFLFVQRGWLPDLVILDYIDEVKKDTGIAGWEADGRNMSEFKAWMMQRDEDRGMCGITATQVNREGTNVEEISMRETSGGFAKNFKVDAAWSINHAADEKAAGIMRISALKHRNGKCGYQILVKVDFASCQFKEIDENTRNTLMTAYTQRTAEINPVVPGSQKTKTHIPRKKDKECEK